MTAVSISIPSESDLLCEVCGYVLNGIALNADTRCPECGHSTTESSPGLRSLPAWETLDRPIFSRWLDTTKAIWFHPAAFYRTLATRRSPQDAAGFAHIHWALASGLFAAAAFGHARWLGLGPPGDSLVLGGVLFAGVVLTVFFLLLGMNRLAASLTHWEGSYRGLRLPLPVVMRGLQYHAAHYLPVAIIAAITVWGYQYLIAQKLLNGNSATTYLYVLSGEVIVLAGYLFRTYWTGMRNMMYANG